MKNRVIVLITFLCIASSLAAQETGRTKLEGEMLNGRVKKLTEKSYSYKSNKADSINKYSIVYLFNESGTISRRQGLGQDISYIYNTNNQILKSIVCCKGTNYCSTNEYTYKKGKLTKHLLKFPHSNSKVKDYFDYNVYYYYYNTEGKLIEKKDISKSRNAKTDVVTEHKRFQYDINGDCVIEEIISDNGKVVERIEKKYSNHMLVETFSWQLFEGENLYIRVLYEYNEDKTTRSQTKIVYSYNSTDDIDNKCISNYTYIYNNQHRLLKYAENNTSYLYRGRYDNEHILIDDTQTYTKNKVCNYNDFDINGNWCKKTFDDNGDLTIIQREFEYF
jgi:hypothetical protein